MLTQRFFFVAAVLLFVILLGGLLLRAIRRESESAETSWAKLVARLAQVNKEAVKLIATDLLEGRDQVAPESLYGMLGGLNGLVRLESNCEVLIELATYVQRWHPEAVVAAEELRLAAREMKWHVERLQGASAAGHLKTTFPDNALQAVRVYHGMTRRVLALYEDTAFGDISALRHAL